MESLKFAPHRHSLHRRSAAVSLLGISLLIACSPSATSSCETDACEVETDTDLSNSNEPNLAFVTSIPVDLSYPASWTQSPAGQADLRCREAAQSAGLPGTYRAWFTNEEDEPAPTRLRGASGWVRLDGKPLAATAEDLALANLWYPLSVDEYGNDRRADELVVRTDTDVGGVGGDLRDLCTGGSASSMTARWGSLYSVLECEQAHVYCLGIDREATVTAEEQPGRRTFVSRGEFSGGVGVAAFDQACQSEADAAALGGQFIAFVAADGDSALDRVGPGEPWVNLRGQRLRENGSLDGAGALDTAVSTFADGEVADTVVWAGATSPDKAPELRNCENWTTEIGGSSCGLSGSVTQWFSVDEMFGCRDERPVLCFEI